MARIAARLHLVYSSTTINQRQAASFIWTIHGLLIVLRLRQKAILFDIVQEVGQDKRILQQGQEQRWAMRNKRLVYILSAGSFQ